MSSIDPKLKVYKAEEKIKNRTVSLREHYENWHGVAGGDPSMRFDGLDWNSMTPEQMQEFMDLETLKSISGLDGVELEENYM